MTGRILSVSPQALRGRMRAGLPTPLFDVRSVAEYRTGHIDGARSVPLEKIDAGRLAEQTGIEEIGSATTLYLACQSGVRASQAAEKLHDAGLHNVVVLDGGTEAWEKAGFPMRRCGGAVSLERQVQIAIGALLILKVLFGFTVHELFFLVAALIGAGLVTAGITRWCGMARLIARMPWNRGRDCADEVPAAS